MVEQQAGRAPPCYRYGTASKTLDKKPAVRRESRMSAPSSMLLTSRRAWLPGPSRNPPHSSGPGSSATSGGSVYVVIDHCARFEYYLPIRAYLRSRTLNSVSSQPTGRETFALRPTEESKYPAVSNAVRRNDMLAPTGLRTSALVSGKPR